MRRDFALLATLVAAAACTKESGPPREGIWGIAAYDRLYALRVEGGSPLLYATDMWPLPDRTLEELGRALDDALSADPRRLPPAARVALQNDVWGLAQRIDTSGQSSDSLSELRKKTVRLVRTLAPSADELRRVDGTKLPESILAHLPGLTERASELPNLQHERLFGFRRIFRVLVGDDRRALVSQLVALDAEGNAHLTSVPGEIEALRFEDKKPAEARVFKLDRRALRLNEAPLVEAKEISHVPSDGALGFLARFGPSKELVDLPCIECHDDDHTMSLPTEVGHPSDRWQAILDQAKDITPRFLIAR